MQHVLPPGDQGQTHRSRKGWEESVSKAPKKSTLTSYRFGLKKVCVLKGCPFFLLKLARPLWNKCLDDFPEGKKECFVTNSRSLARRALPRRVTRYLPYAGDGPPSVGSYRDSEGLTGAWDGPQHQGYQVRAQSNMKATAESRGRGCGRGWGRRGVGRESDDGKVFSGREGRRSPPASSEDARKTSLATGEGGEQVIKADRAPRRSLGRQAGSTGVPSWAQGALEAPEQEKSEDLGSGT